LKTLFDLCQPRNDVLTGRVAEADYAADLAQVIDGKAAPEYQQADLFFTHTHPTHGLRALLANVAQRLDNQGGVSSIFRLDTQYGGGKTHALIALAHLAGGMRGVANVAEFIDPALVPPRPVTVAAFDGENADPSNGRDLGQGLRAYTPWGELAYRIAGVAGYEDVRNSDHDRVAPGADTLRSLFGGKPALILLDELSIYLRKVRGRPDADQLAPFLTSLFKAVESAPGVVLVFTLAIGKGGLALDAYADDNRFISAKMDEAEKIVARKATVLDPTAEDEVAHVLRRRLFQSIDDAGAAEVVAAYQALWTQHAGELPPVRLREDRAAALQAGYPFHPALMATLNDKLATLDNFQRVRGMLRLLTQTVARLWEPTNRPQAYAIHLHHLDPSFEPTHNEVVTRLGQHAYDPAMRVDVGSPGGEASLAENLDAKHYAGLAPYATYVARTILWHTFAFNDQLKGVSPEELRYSVLGPGLDLGFINQARQLFMAESAYLDDRPGAPLRFSAEANLTQIIRRQQELVDPAAVRDVLATGIADVFSSGDLEMVRFPGGPYEVPDEVGNGKPLLVLISYDADVVGARLQVPELVEKIFRFKGQQNDYRARPNNLVFLVADEARRDEMRARVTLRLALRAMQAESVLKDLADHQRDSVREAYKRSEQEMALAIQQCYRHLFYPSRNNQIEGALVELGHTAFDVGAAEKPGAGQNQVLRSMADASKLLRDNDQPLGAGYVRDLTPLAKGQMTTLEVRDEFRKNVRLPIMLGDGNFLEMVRRGAEQSVWVYTSGDLLYGPGDPFTAVKIDNQSALVTMALATQQGIWPRPSAEKPTEQPPVPPVGGQGTLGGFGGGGTGGGGTVIIEPPPGVRTFQAEAPLKEALTVLWEQARQAKAAALGTLSLRAFDPTDIFRLLTAIDGVAGAEKHVDLAAGYESKAGASLELEFKGTPEDAKPVKDFLEQEFRLATEKQLNVTYTLTFPNGLALSGNAPENLAERLTRFSTGAALVQATAQEA